MARAREKEQASQAWGCRAYLSPKQNHCEDANLRLLSFLRGSTDGAIERQRVARDGAGVDTSEICD